MTDYDSANMHGHTYEEMKHPACVPIVILHEMGKERAWLFLTKLRPKSSKCALGNAVISVSDLSEVLDYQIMPTRQSELSGLSEGPTVRGAKTLGPTLMQGIEELKLGRPQG